MNIEEVEDAIVAWITDLLGMKSIIAYPNAGRPVTSYVLINVLSDGQIGTEEDDGKLTPIYSSLNEITISLNTYYLSAFQKAIDIKKSLMMLEVEDQLWAAGLGYVSATPVQKIPELIDKKWEERAQFDVVFNIREKTEIESIGSIEQTTITNEIDGTTTTIGES